jgi:glycerol-3-phosphate acyltransferase PlsY
MGYVIVILAAYLIGTSNMAFYLSRMKRYDIRSDGSGNLGASNTTLILGWRAGVLVGAHDIGKSALAAILAQLIFPELPYIGALAGAASILGHIYPFYLGFKGGKGFASFIGAALVLNFNITLLVLALMALVTWFSDYIVLGTLTTVLLVPLGIGLVTGSVVVPLILLTVGAVILLHHRENFVRIAKGKEIGLKSAIKGEHKKV